MVTERVPVKFPAETPLAGIVIVQDDPAATELPQFEVALLNVPDASGVRLRPVTDKEV